MKKVCFVIAFGMVLLFASCSSYKDSNRYISLEIQDAFTIENNENYVVGDTIFIGLNFSRYLEEDGYPNLLDIYESSGMEEYSFNLRLERFSEQSNAFRSVAIAEEFLVAEKGGFDIYGDPVAKLNSNKTQYEARIGVILVEQGQYRFDFDFIYINSIGFDEDRVSINLSHSFGPNPPNFEFTVTE